MLRQTWEEMVLLPFLTRNERKRARLILERAVKARGWGIVSPYGHEGTRRAWMDYLDYKYGIDGYDDTNIDRFLELPLKTQKELERGAMILLSPEGGPPGPRKREKLFGRTFEHDPQAARESAQELVEKFEKLLEKSEQNTQNPQ